jgi:hypothetical protein
MLVLSMFAFSSWALVSEYTFASSLSNYSEISGGTVLVSGPDNTNANYNAIPLGFSFTYNGTAYTTVSVNENGFLAMGDVVTSNYFAISTATGTNNVVAGISRDIRGRDDGQLMYLLTGEAPNRVFTVQWKNYRRNATAALNDIFNFQIQLHENNNKVIVSYGAFTAVTVSTMAAVQVGLRGASADDYNNRTTTTDWSATTAGTANNSNCSLSPTVFPATGLTYTFSPAQQGELLWQRKILSRQITL